MGKGEGGGGGEKERREETQEGAREGDDQEKNIGK